MSYSEKRFADRLCYFPYTNKRFCMLNGAAAPFFTACADSNPREATVKFISLFSGGPCLSLLGFLRQSFGDLPQIVAEHRPSHREGPIF